MMELLLPIFETKVDFSDARLRLLDGSKLSWAEMLRLFRDLMPLMPDPVLYIIDRLDWLDDRSTVVLLDEFLETLRDSKLRVLFTTTGRAASLKRKINRSDIVVIETLDVKNPSWTLERNHSWGFRAKE
jgi:hypothetical protein